LKSTGVCRMSGTCANLCRYSAGLHHFDLSLGWAEIWLGAR
jgi:hypothetical protein